jgi:hypothetical protein
VAEKNKIGRWENPKAKLQAAKNQTGGQKKRKSSYGLKNKNQTGA